jgi:hypothetical protein
MCFETEPDAIGASADVDGIEQVGLLVATTQATAIQLYQSLGFRSLAASTGL